MAFTPHETDDIEYLAGAMKVASEALAKLAGRMKAEKLAPIYLQLNGARAYADQLYKLPGEIDFQFTNQLYAKKTGSLPSFRQRQKKNALDKAKRDAKKNLAALDIVKKPTKKQPKTR